MSRTQRVDSRCLYRITIRSLCDPTHWRHVPGESNPADLLTKPRPMHATDLSLWVNGPPFLQQYNAFWLAQHEPCVNLPDDDPEVTASVLVCATTDDAALIPQIIEYFSSWTRICKSVAWFCRFVRYLRDHSSVESGPLTASEICHARCLIVRFVQRAHFPQEYSDLSAGKVLRPSSKLIQLDPFLDSDGLLRVGGRVPDESPILLPHDSRVALLVVEHHHDRVHTGVEWTLARIRKEWWIVRARPLVKRVKRACVVCKKLYAKPKAQMMANLPPERITPGQPAFTFVGLDAFGPYAVAYRRSSIKRYGCIFTCMTTRAIHLEMLDSLESDSFINALRRFIARRGVPRKIFSDNGTNFVGGEREMIKAAEFDIEWAYNPPNAPHMGGVWERMVGVVKRALEAMLGSACRLTDDILTTAFCEAESLVNSRPLTKLTDDPNDLYPLTPAKLLHMSEGPPFTASGTKSDAYRKRWRFVQHLADQFWSRWTKEYLPLLQTRTKWQLPSDDIKVGELVLVMERGAPRGVWPLGRVEQVHTGRDGRVRRVAVRTATSNFDRAVNSLVRLELDCE